MKPTLEQLQSSVIYNDDEALKLLKQNSRISKAKQLKIYQEGYLIRLSEAVRSDYPTFHHYLQNEAETLIEDYVKNYPSNFYSLDFYPFKFSDFVQTKNILQAAKELAILESKIAQIFYAKDSQALAAGDIANMSEAQLDKFRFQPRSASDILEFEYDVENYLQNFRAGKNPSEINQSKNYIYIVRNNNEVKRFYLSSEEFFTLKKLFAGCAVDEALTDKTSQNLFAEWLNKWLFNGFFDKKLFSHS